MFFLYSVVLISILGLLVIATLAIRQHRRTHVLHARCVKLCHSIADELSHKQEAALVTQRIFNLVIAHTNASVGLLSLWSEADGGLRVRKTHGLPDSLHARGRLLADLPGWKHLDNHIPETPVLIRVGVPEALLELSGKILDRRQNMLNIPVSGPGDTRGLLQLISAPGEDFDHQHVNDLGGVGLYVGAAIRNASLIEAIGRQRDSAELLYEIGLDIAGFLNLESIISYAVEQGHRIMESDLTWYLEWARDESHALEVVKLTGETHGLFKVSDHIPLNENALALLDTVHDTQQHGYMMLPDIDVLHNDERFCEQSVYQKFAELGIHSALIVTVGDANHMKGLLCTFARPKDNFGSVDIDLMQRLANQVLIALNTAQLHVERRELAISEEREQLSNEIHDNMAQVINGLSLEIHTLGKRAGQHPAEDARAVDMGPGLARLNNLVSDAKAAIREAIFELRLPANSHFEHNLGDFIRAFERWHEMTIQAELPAQALPMPLARQRQALRIVQEMLWNVRKHSGGSSATVTARVDDRHHTLCIATHDPGRGADLTTLASGQGIATMKSRAQHLGGQLHLSPGPDGGLRVELEFPLAVA